MEQDPLLYSQETIEALSAAFLAEYSDPIFQIHTSKGKIAWLFAAIMSVFLLVLILIFEKQQVIIALFETVNTEGSKQVIYGLYFLLGFILPVLFTHQGLVVEERNARRWFKQSHIDFSHIEKYIPVLITKGELDSEEYVRLSRWVNSFNESSMLSCSDAFESLTFLKMLRSACLKRI